MGNSSFFSGDVHVPEAKPFADIVAAELKRAHMLNPLAVIVESPGFHDQFIQSEPVKVLYGLVHSYKGRKNFAIKLTCCEPRGSLSDFLELFRSAVGESYSIVMENVDSSIINLHDSEGKLMQDQADTWLEWNKKKNELLLSKIIIAGDSRTTVKSFEKYLDANLTLIQSISERHKDTEFARLFEAILKVYSESVRTIKGHLGKKHKKDQLGKMLLEEIYACTTPAAFASWFVSWQKCYLLQCDYLVFDAALLDRMVSSMSNLSPLCVVIGETHADKLSRLLTQSLGWTTLDECSKEQVIFLSSEKGHTGENALLKDFGVKLGRVMQRVLEPLKAPRVIGCAMCPKTENVKACSRCKDVYYCGTECQMSGWKEHKKVCLPEKIKL